MTFWFLCHAWFSLIASQYHFSSHLFQYGIVVIYDCGILRQTLAVVYCSTAVSVEAVLLVQDSAPGVHWRSAAPKTGSEDPWLSVLWHCSGSYPGVYLDSDPCAWKNMLFAVGASAWQASWDCWIPFTFKIQVLKLVLGVSCFWFQWSAEYVVNCRMGEQ